MYKEKIVREYEMQFKFYRYQTLVKHEDIFRKVRSAREDGLTKEVLYSHFYCSNICFKIYEDFTYNFVGMCRFSSKQKK
jgi:hypothetical protein